MKDLYRGYYNPDESAYKAMWNNAIFIFDTNVLLSLYRYQSKTVTSLLDVVEKLNDRIWIPYHVGLEYQRRRIDVIAGQHDRFSQVKKIMQAFANDVDKAASRLTQDLDALQLKKRHSLISRDDIVEDVQAKTIGALKSAQEQHVEKLNDLERESISTSSEDVIRTQLEALFSNKIGLPPASQEILDQLYKEGEQRYRKSIPPGFKDANKANTKNDKEPECFTYAGLEYRRQYGDLIIWKQILEYAKANTLKDLVFVTDDSKEDWWKVSKGKTVGVHPELVDEIHREAGVENFHIYNTESFLEYANMHLKTNVAKDTIDEVREIQTSYHARLVGRQDPGSFIELCEAADEAMYRWISNRYVYVERGGDKVGSYFAAGMNGSSSFVVKFLYGGKMSTRELHDLFERAIQSFQSDKVLNTRIMLLAIDIEAASDVYNDIVDYARARLLDNMGVIIGTFGGACLDKETMEFQVYREIGYSDPL